MGARSARRVRMVSSITGITDRDWAAEVQAFFDAHPVPQGEKTLAQNLERMKREQGALEKLLRDAGYREVARHGAVGRVLQAAGQGVPGVVRHFEPNGSQVNAAEYAPFSLSWLGGVRVARADLTADGVADRHRLARRDLPQSRGNVVLRYRWRRDRLFPGGRRYQRDCASRSQKSHFRRSPH